jgi:predicted ATPase
MYVKRIVLENVRGFESLDFDLRRSDGSYAGWTVITGDNGSGKSALLKDIALAVSGRTHGRILQPSLKGWIRSGHSEAIIAVQIAVDPYDDKFTGRGRTKDEPFWAELSLIGNDSAEPELRESKEYTGKGKRTPIRGPWSDTPTGWFCCGYGPFRRLYGSSADAVRLMAGPSRVARFVTMFREDAALSECERWLTVLHNRYRDGREEFKAPLEHITHILDDDFLQHGMRIERIDAEGLWLRDQSGIVLPLVDMSDGYRAALAILTDVFRHMVDCYGLEGLVEMQDGHPIVARAGVVMIDEADAHLYPEWQRQIGFWLKQRFPQVQFIVTSHSPIICQAADSDGLFRLLPPGSGQRPFKLSEEDYQRVINSKPDEILISPAFGLAHTRSPEAVKKRRRHAELKAKKAAGHLSAKEAQELGQLSLSLFPDEEE